MLNWEILDPSRETIPDDLRVHWSGMVAASDNPFSLHQSPEWFDHLKNTGLEGRAFLALSRDQGGRLVAIAPLTIDSRRISLHVARGFILPSPPLSMIRIWGGRASMPETKETMDGLVDAISRRFPHCGGVDLFGVELDSGFLNVLTNADSVRRGFAVAAREGMESIDLISLPRTYDEFMGRYSSKKRYNIRRQIRQAREAAGGNLVLCRVERPDAVAGLLEAIKLLGGPIMPPSEGSRLRDLASRGMLRSYVLKAAGRPIACLMGKQHGGTYLVDWTCYDRASRNFSPGTTLLHLAIEDLIGDRPGTLINLGYGAAKSSFRATNESHPCGSFWLIRKRGAWPWLLGLWASLRAVVAVLGTTPKRIHEASPPDDPPTNDPGGLRRLDPVWASLATVEARSFPRCRATA